MNTDKSGEGRILSLSTLGEPMSEEEFEDKMNRYELDSEYAEFIQERWLAINAHALTKLMERDDCYQDFKEHMTRGGK